MLRKKLMTRLGLLVVMFVTGAVVSIVLLQGVLSDLDTLKTEEIADRLQAVRADLDAYESLVAQIRRDPGSAAGDLDRAKSGIRQSLGLLADEASRRNASDDVAIACKLVGAHLDAREHDPSGLQQAVSALSTSVRRHMATEQSALSRHLRSLIIGLTIAALLSTNVAIFVLARTANMILRPVDDLIQGSRELAQEHFGFRVQVNQKDEFEELARAYNLLAEQLSANEDRKVKALQQLAVTLNHELNNVISIIELRLKLLDRRNSGDPEISSCVDDVHQNLERMSRTIVSLQHVRRVALTAYMPGQLMLDLPRCIAEEEPPVVPGAAVLPAPVGGIRP